jgi:hypothetical protein
MAQAPTGSRTGKVVGPSWLCCNAAGLPETLHPDHHHAGADSIAFGHLAPRGTALNLFNLTRARRSTARDKWSGGDLSDGPPAGPAP